MKNKIIPITLIALGSVAFSPIYLYAIGLTPSPGVDRGFACFMISISFTFYGAMILWMP